MTKTVPLYTLILYSREYPSATATPSTSSWSDPDHQERSQTVGMWNERRYCWVFLLQRSQRCDERQTNKGQDEATAFPSHAVTWRGSRSAGAKLFFREMLMEFPVATQRLYGEVSYKTVGVEAICSVFPWLGVHVLVPVFLFSATGFLIHKGFFLCVCCIIQPTWLGVPRLQTFLLYGMTEQTT